MDNRIPYFYIITHIPTNMHYAGSKYGKGANPEILMKPGGYHTSSDKIKDLIEEYGLDSFKIELIIKDFDFGIDAHEYETIFLQTWNIAKNFKWLNVHNNTGGFKGSTKSKTKEHQDKINKSLTGRIVSEETRKKISISNSGKSPNEETRKKLSLSGKGRIVSEETKKKISHSHKGKPKSEEHKNKLRAPKTEEHKNKVRLANIGKKASEETKLKMSIQRKGSCNSMYGKTQSEETRDKISQINLGMHWWNDSIKNYVLHKDETPEPHWVSGAVKRNPVSKERREAQSLQQKGSTFWNDGIRNYKILLGDTPREGLIRGKIKKSTKTSNNLT